MVGIWALGYLCEEDIASTLHAIYTNLDDGGTLILNEAVLEGLDEILGVDRAHYILEQQLIVRDSRKYIAAIKAAGFKIAKTETRLTYHSSDLLFMITAKKPAKSSVD